jgi:hypothetical protein
MGISKIRCLLGVELFEISDKYIMELRQAHHNAKEVFDILPEYTINTNEGANNQPIITKYFHQFMGLGDTDSEKYLYFNLHAAANQCSIDDKRFMVRAFALRNLIDNRWRLIINPIITENVGIKETKIEGCLTWKSQYIIAERTRGVKVNYYDLDGNYFENELHYSFEGQIWQHEINHLNGIEENVVENPHST